MNVPLEWASENILDYRRKLLDLIILILISLILIFSSFKELDTWREIENVLVKVTQSSK